MQPQKELHRNALSPAHIGIQQLQDTLSCGCPWKVATKGEGNWEHICIPHDIEIPIQYNVQGDPVPS